MIPATKKNFPWCQPGEVHVKHNLTSYLYEGAILMQLNNTP